MEELRKAAFAKVLFASFAKAIDTYDLYSGTRSRDSWLQAARFLYVDDGEIMSVN